MRYEIVFIVFLIWFINLSVSSSKCLCNKCTCTVNSSGNLAISCRKRNLEGIPENKLLREVKDVATIDLNGNRIAELPANAFRHLKNLTKLLLRDNTIEDADAACFNISGPERHSPLKYVDLRDNHLHFFPSCFGRKNSSIASLKNLKKLLIGGNMFGERLEVHSFAGISNVEEFDLSNNLIREIPDLFFKKLNHLQILDLSANEIEKMSPMIFAQHIPLRVVRLNRNQLNRIPQNLPSTLEELNLSSNKIAGLSASSARHISRLTQLQVLDLSRNKIECLAYGFAFYLSKLKYFDISSNFLKNVDLKVFDGALNLEYMFLHDNSKLEAVLHFNFSNFPRLKYLALHRCNLHSLAILPEAQTGLEVQVSLKSLWLFGNPIICDCYVTPLIHFLQTYNVSLDPQQIGKDFKNFSNTVIKKAFQRKFKADFNHIYSTVCAGPLNRYRVVVGKRLTNISTSDLSCPDEMRYVIISSFLGIFAFLGVIPVVTILIHIYLLLLKFVQKHFVREKDKED